MADIKNTKLIDTNALLYYHKEIKKLLELKVDKVTGYSLMSDAEITRLSTVVNYNDTSVQSAISTMKNQIASLEQGTYDDTQLRADIASTYATIAALSAHTGNTTVHITAAERTAWNAKANTADLADVATSGAYSDLSGAPTSLPASDVSAWAKAGTKPSYTYTEVGADASGAASAAQAAAKAYTDGAVSGLESTINSKLTSAMHYKGSKDTFADLPNTAEVGDVWNIVNAGVDTDGHAFSAGANVAWNGTKWDVLPGTVDLTNYYNTADIAVNSDIDTILNS